MSTTVELPCAAECLRERSGFWAAVSRFVGLIPLRAEAVANGLAEGCVDEDEVLRRSAARRQWNPPAWWDHL